MLAWTSKRLIGFKRILNALSDESIAALGSDPRYETHHKILQGTIHSASDQIAEAEKLVASVRNQIDVAVDAPSIKLVDKMVVTLANKVLELERMIDSAAEQLHAAAGTVALDYVQLHGTPKETSTSVTYQAPQKIFQASGPEPTTQSSKNMRRARRLLLDWLLALSTGLLFMCIGPFKSSDSETLLGFRIICVVYAAATYAVWHSHAPGDFWSVADTWVSKSAHNISTLLCGVGPVIWVSTYVYQGDDGGWGVLLTFYVIFVPATFLVGHGICAFLVHGGWSSVFNGVTYYMF